MLFASLQYSHSHATTGEIVRRLREKSASFVKVAQEPIAETDEKKVEVKGSERGMRTLLELICEVLC
jgi:hypothetical protein